MKKHIYAGIFWGLFLVTFQQVSAGVGFGTVSTVKDTFFFDEELVITTHLINNGPQVYTGTVDFKFKLNGVVNYNRNIFPNPLEGYVVNLSVGDSIPCVFRIPVTSAYFTVGPDILVVWPILENGAVAEGSLLEEIFVLDNTTGIDDDDYGTMKPYFRDGYLLWTESSHLFNRVRIFNLNGALLKDIVDAHSAINLDDLPNSLYFVEVISAVSHKRKVFKVVKL